MIKYRTDRVKRRIIAGVIVAIGAAMAVSAYGITGGVW